MSRWLQFRVLIAAIAVSTGAGLAELATDESSVRAARARANRELLRRYPERPEHLYLRGRRALEQGNEIRARRLFERALERRLHTEEGLLHDYARLLIRLRAPRHEIDEATATWRKHFPHSKNPSPLESMR